MSADKATIEIVLKNSDEMSKWSCERVSQYLDEINLGQYKQVRQIYFIPNTSFCLKFLKSMLN